MGNRESQLLSRSPSAGPAVAASVAASISVSSSSGGPSLSGGSLSLPSFSRRSLASSLSSLGIKLAAFGAPLAEHESPLHSPESPSQTLSAAAAAEAAVARTRPRIHPIMRGGRQLSEDLHWLLPPRTRRRQPPPSPKSRQEELAEVATADTSATYGPGRTPLDLVRRVTEQVFGVTDEESCVALSLHRWDPDAAARYLKVEQLFRLGIADRDECRELLGAHGWRLETACAAVFLS